MMSLFQHFLFCKFGARKAQHLHHYLEIGLNEVVLFVKKGHILPLADGGECVDQVDWENLKLYHFAPQGADYELYDDDGVSAAAVLEGHIRLLKV